MRSRFNFNTCVSYLLSTGLVLGPCHGAVDQPFYNDALTLEEMGIESLGLDSHFKKLVKPIKDLKPSDGNQKMARTVLKFLSDLNAVTGSRLCIDDGVSHAAAIYYSNGKPKTDREVAAFRNLLRSQNKCCPEGHDEEFSYDLKKDGKKEFGNIDDMTENEVWSWCFVFAGCLMMIIPNGLCQSIGAGMVTTGLYGVGQAGFEEKDKKK